MFLKPFRVKTQTVVKGSDRKKLRLDVEQQFPCLSSAQVADLIPGKGDISQAKIVTHSDGDFVVYCNQKNPIFFESFKKLYPTVYTLWKFPDMLPVFTTYSPVFDKLLKGADLMLPGVEVKGEPHPKMFGDLQKGDLCLIRLKGNRAPVSLGQAVLSGEDMYMSAMKGKGVHPIHILGDHLWEMGDQSKPPLIPDDEADDDSNDEEENGDDAGTPTQAAEGASQLMEELSVQEKGEENSTAGAAAVESGVGSDVGDDDGDEDEGAAEGEEASERPGPEENMDDLLQFCFKCAIKGRVGKSDLPLLTSTFLKGHMQPFCVAGQHLDLKKSSYKKFSKFLQQMETEGFIRMKEVSKGVDAIVEIDRSHPELRGFAVREIVEEESGGDSAEERFQPPQITDVLCVTAATLPLLSPLGFPKGSTLTVPQLREVVTDYVKANNLQAEDSREHVLLDPILAHLALTKSEGDLSHLTWNTLFSRIMEKMQPGCLIQFPGKPPILKKGKVDPIKLDVEQRGSKKKVTTVQYLEAFGIDPRHFAQTVQRMVAGSASVVQSEQKSRGQDVQVQGNQIDFIVKHLLEIYKIPRKYIQGAEKAPKTKRR